MILIITEPDGTVTAVEVESVKVEPASDVVYVKYYRSGDVVLRSGQHYEVTTRVELFSEGLPAPATLYPLSG